ncbi:hypothetical protein FP435_01050 [Lactobacillus sp. PV037]|uniref:hypothetical protein n=1 Tax=Lactobacillus sp. PV037 TaxID=2594496 RepID=UPI00223EAF3B|nr:hypothetical protein [Lactobacillus sp. PV037]QNQ83124.1 hypothetical protein FP435_01050 [Lactobacillus sp. PV037]
MKFKKRQKIISFYDEWNFIATKKMVNANKVEFFLQAKEFIEDKKLNLSNNNNVEKVDRLFDLIKWTDILIDDDGNLSGNFRKYLKLLKRLKSRDDLICRQRSKVKRMILEIKLLKKISRKFENCMIRFKIFPAIDFSSIDYETNCRYMSDYLHGFNTILSLTELNKISYDKYFINKEQYKLIISLWKYADAKLRKVKRYIEIDAVTEELKCYLGTMLTNSEVRQVNFKTHLDKFPRIEDYIFQGLASIFYIPIKPTFKEYSSSEQKLLQKYSNQKLYNVELKKWLKFLVDIQITTLSQKNIRKNNLFIKIKYSQNNSLTSKEREIMINKLSFGKECDLLDKPFIYGKYVFLPSIVHLDPVYVMSKLMRQAKDVENRIEVKDKLVTWQDFIGNQYEKYYYNLFIEKNTDVNILYIRKMDKKQIY